MVIVMHLLSRAALCCLVALPLAACGTKEARQFARVAGPVLGALVTPQPVPKPQKPRKAQRLVTKD